MSCTYMLTARIIETIDKITDKRYKIYSLIEIKSVVIPI